MFCFLSKKSPRKRLNFPSFIMQLSFKEFFLFLAYLVSPFTCFAVSVLVSFKISCSLSKASIIYIWRYLFFRFLATSFLRDNLIFEYSAFLKTFKKKIKFPSFLYYANVIPSKHFLFLSSLVSPCIYTFCCFCSWF